MRTLIHTGIAAVVLSATLASPTIAGSPTFSTAMATLAGGNAPKDGDIVEHKFSTPPLNSGGLKSLAELRGRPLLIEFWGTR